MPLHSWSQGNSTKHSISNVNVKKQKQNKKHKYSYSWLSILMGVPDVMWGYFISGLLRRSWVILDAVHVVGSNIELSLGNQMIARAPGA
jgi:hypothetical protein